MTLNSLAAKYINLPCDEVKPFEPFPFKSARISRGVRFKHFLIFFPFYPEYKKCKHLYTFNLETLEWSSAELINSPEILENTSNFTILVSDENQFILFGCYKTFNTTRTNNLFSQSQTAVVNKAFGFINARFIEGQLSLKWEAPPAGWKELPYLERCSASISGRKMWIFGGSDENENVTNILYKYEIQTGTWEEVKLYNKDDGTEENIPRARESHGGFVYDSRLYIFGGEGKDSEKINDLWELTINMEFQNEIACRRINKDDVFRRPKVGTPSLDFGKYRYYMGQASHENNPPIRNFLCADEIPGNHQTVVKTFSSQKNLPFDGIPHTMEMYQNFIILGFESSIYAISLDGKPLEPSSPAMSFDSHMMSLVKSPKQKTYKDNMRGYFEERPYPDVVFKVQGEEVSAHKGILSVRSKFFHELFTNETNREKGSFEILDLSPAAFTRLLEWLYCDNVLEMKDAEAVELLKVGGKYLVLKLKEEAERCLVKNLTIENVLERAKLAVESSSKSLEDAVVKFAVKEIDEVNKREELNQFPPGILQRIIKAKK